VRITYLDKFPKMRNNIGVVSSIVAIGGLLILIINLIRDKLTWESALIVVAAIIIGAILSHLTRPTDAEESAFKARAEKRIAEAKARGETKLPRTLRLKLLAIGVLFVALMIGSFYI
jgi:hypothetical protein